jgi:purine-binding chemotaxis protein CheW
MIALANPASQTKRELQKRSAEEMVVFSLLGESYALPVQQVREVIRLQAIRPIPKSAAFVEGVICLRGRVIAVLDLRKRLDLPGGEHTGATRILIVRMPRSLVGLIVDSVQEVLTIPFEAVRQTPLVEAADANAPFSRGIATIGSRLILLLDLRLLFSAQETRQLERVGAELQKGTADV